MSTSIRIGFFIQHFPPYLGGAERQARLLALQLVAEGNIVEVITTRYTKSLDKQTIDEGLAVKRVPTLSPRWLKLPVNFILGFSYGLAVAGRVDLFHGHCLSPFCLGALLAARLRRRPMAIKICSIGTEGDIARIRGFGPGTLFWRLFRGADLLFAPTTDVAKELISEGVHPERIGVFPNLMEGKASMPSTSERVALRHRLGLANRVTLIYVGRLHPGKGLATLRGVWPKIVSHCDAQLLIVGDGEEMGIFSDWRQRLPEKQRVYLTGHQQDPSLYYRASDIFVFPSLSETFGNVVIEAMSHGLAIVTTTVGVVREWGDEAPVIRVGIGDSSGLSRALIELIEQATLRNHLGSTAADFIAGRYGVAPIAARYQRCYVRLLGLSDDQ